MKSTVGVAVATCQFIALKNAKRIFFLGFGFDEKNMVKLGINVEGIKFDWESKYIAGTRIGGLI